MTVSLSFFFTYLQMYIYFHIYHLYRTSTNKDTNIHPTQSTDSMKQPPSKCHDDESTFTHPAFSNSEAVLHNPEFWRFKAKLRRLPLL